MSLTGRSKWLSNYMGNSVREGRECKETRTKHEKRSELDLWLWLILHSHSSASVFYGPPPCRLLTLPTPHLHSAPPLHWLCLQLLIFRLSIMAGQTSATGKQPLRASTVQVVHVMFGVSITVSCLVLQFCPCVSCFASHFLSLFFSSVIRFTCDLLMWPFLCI